MKNVLDSLNRLFDLDIWLINYPKKATIISIKVATGCLLYFKHNPTAQRQQKLASIIRRQLLTVLSKEKCHTLELYLQVSS